jgi:spermidine synthase
MILALFFCSGATALVYEVIWSKYLSLMFGSTVQAQTIVLAVFMGGLALGNRILGKLADRVRQPLFWYGCLEAAIGLYAFFFEPLFRLTDTGFVFFGSRWLSHPGLVLWLKGSLSVSLLLGPTVLMGGTCRCWPPGCSVPRVTRVGGRRGFTRRTAWGRFVAPGWLDSTSLNHGAWFQPCR